MAKCTDCGAEIKMVRDELTGATFPVSADPVEFSGFALFPPAGGERRARARRESVKLYAPHHPCPGSVGSDAPGPGDEESEPAGPPLDDRDYV